MVRQLGIQWAWWHRTLYWRCHSSLILVHGLLVPVLLMPSVRAWHHHGARSCCSSWKLWRMQLPRSDQRCTDCWRANQHLSGLPLSTRNACEVELFCSRQVNVCVFTLSSMNACVKWTEAVELVKCTEMNFTVAACRLALFVVQRSSVYCRNCI